MSEVELLRTEIAQLREQLNLVQRNNDLSLILSCFIGVIVLAVVVSLWKEILPMWRHFEYLMVPKQSTALERSMRLHDIFNIIALPFIVILDFNFILKGNLDDYDNSNFWIFLWYTVAYIAIDMVWVAIVPTCVKSQATILVHHAITLLYLGIPMHNPVTRYAMAVDLLVELNTWFLIMRRQPLAKGAGRLLIAVPFYFTWYSIRCIVYPYMVYDIYYLWVDHVNLLQASGDPSWHRASYGFTYMFIPIIFQTMLSALNIHWSVQLLKNDWRGKRPDKGL